jgi:hypothetical protein
MVTAVGPSHKDNRPVIIYQEESQEAILDWPITNRYILNYCLDNYQKIRLFPLAYKDIVMNVSN